MDVLLNTLRGVPVTLGITLIAFAIGVVGGVPLALMRRSRIKPISWLAIAIIELLRGIPPVVWLFIIFFGLGTSIPQMTAFMAAVIGLGIVAAAYMAEIYRGGLRSIHNGQWEAAEVLGMRHRTVLRDVIGPQVFRVSIPAAATYGIGLLKDSSVAYVIGVTEIVYYASEQSRQTVDAIGPFLIAAAVYVIMTIPTAWATRSLDAKMRKRVAK
ncbi:amino acid ABC transporter permease [Gulosibacter macacae]|uniref:Amino acid ABC transporter permease n=1 Tax=Gulosibacter macacae TaxID=2488791 RepID=A0A3P3W0R9_9MICO|nr:amino acid ABC transporter permease [Gulosibacter macacae]RRJ87938.1 amino acid ABC transporter permease [Gulosibacter macacae]